MKLDPADVFGSAAGGLIARGAMAWLAVWLGMVGAGGMDAVGLGSLLMLPFAMLGHAVVGGGWIIVTLPLVAFLGWRLIDFIRGEGWWSELGILMMLSLGVCLPASRGPSVFGFLIIVVGAMMLGSHLRRSEG